MNYRIPFTGRMLSINLTVRLEPMGAEPLQWPKAARKVLAMEIRELMEEGRSVPDEIVPGLKFSAGKIGAIKACRYILHERGLETKLLPCKEFVDAIWESELQCSSSLLEETLLGLSDLH